MSRIEPYDVIIAGSGATGGWAAKVLTEQGLRVLLCEAGPSLDLADELHRRPPAPQSGKMSGHQKHWPLLRGGSLLQRLAPGAKAQQKRQPKKTYQRQPTQSTCYAFTDANKHLFIDDEDNPYEIAGGKPFAWIRMRLLGGRTTLWNRIVLRMSDRQFKAASVDGFGDDWPIGYAELAPHYHQIEQFLGVCGIKENLPEVPDGDFIPVPLSPEASAFKYSLQERWPDRRLTLLRRTSLVDPAMLQSDWHEDWKDPDETAPFYCSVGSTIAAAMRTGRLMLKANAVVSHVITSGDGKRATGLAYVDRLSGETHEVHGKAVMLCASALESTRILLNSASRAHPGGLGSSSGTLGRYLSDHTFGVSVTGRRKMPSTGRSQFYIPNFRNLDGDKAAFLRGYGIQGEVFPVGEDTTECCLRCFGEVLPRPRNAVSLSDTVKDRWGIPALKIDCTYSDNEFAMSEDQGEQAAEIMRAAGYDIMKSSGMAPPGYSMHECGTARMGSDPASSVLNGYAQCWDVPNVFVADGAAFTSSGFQNPTLTMMAIAGRAAHYLAAELKRGASSLA